eukprot:6212423-Pleurochrysis_carterae.AAC.1
MYENLFHMYGTHEQAIVTSVMNEPPIFILRMLDRILLCMASIFSSSSSMTFKCAGLHCVPSVVPYAPRACSATAETPPPAMARDA